MHVCSYEMRLESIAVPKRRGTCLCRTLPTRRGVARGVADLAPSRVADLGSPTNVARAVAGPFRLGCGSDARAIF
jgi:hypothetical protein